MPFGRCLVHIRALQWIAWSVETASSLEFHYASLAAGLPAAFFQRAWRSVTFDTAQLKRAGNNDGSIRESPMSYVSRSRLPRLSAVYFAFVTAIAGAAGNDHGLDPRNVDPATAACVDFFQHANGGWLKANPIPAAYSEWSLDDELNERNLLLLKTLLEGAAAKPGDHGSNTQKIGDFYAAAMDQAAIEKAGIAPLKNDLAAIAALKSTDDVAALIRDWQSKGVGVLFDLEAQEDLKDSSKQIAYAGQGGLGLPDRDYYTRDDAKSKDLRVRYRAHIARLLALSGDGDTDKKAAAVLDLETRLAKASLDRVALREPLNSYHIFSVSDADAKTSHFSWSKMFHAAGRDDIQRFSLAQPDFFTVADQALADTPVSTWQAYLRWHLLSSAAPYLSKSFVDADFDFRQHTLRGAREIKPRWKRVIRAADGALGEVLGEAYVAKTFPPQAKQRAIVLVNNLKTALRARIENLAWMSAETKKSAYAKLDTLVAKIGYPDKWRDYSTLEISRASYVENMRAAAAYEAHRVFAKFDRPPDKTEWDMTPQTINAYYNPMRNEIVFPAAQLQPPYFDAAADDALNYGGIGTVIGHEMVHGFDDQGSQFDSVGNLADWWTKDDHVQFESRTGRLVEQFNGYVPIDDLHLNGKLSLGENIADLGGLLVAYDAYKLTPQGKAAAPIDGLSPDQRFFLSYAQVWRTSERPEQLRLLVQSNEHAPPKFRVNGPLSDIAAFSAAFSCKAGTAMSRELPVQIW
jgi:putative endopeptidase